MRAFESAIEKKTNSDQDKLFCLEQYTCGLREAKRLLQYHNGNDLKIATAYLDKAFKCPQIKAEYAKGLKAYALFIIEYQNTMTDVEFMEETDNPCNMRIVISKLPYEVKERWRNTTFDLKNDMEDEHGLKTWSTSLIGVHKL